MSGVSESTPPPAMTKLEQLVAAPNSPNQTQTQSPPAVTDTPATPVVSQTPVEPSPTPEATLFTPQPQSDDQMQMAYTADGSANAAVVFGAINSSPPTQVSIPPGAIIVRHLGNTGSTWMKRKRGLPRYFGLFTRVTTQAQPEAVPPRDQPQAVPPPQPGHSESQPPVVDLASPPAKKARRPPGSNKKQKMEALGNMGSSGVKFIPHVIDVEAGEDVASKIMAFSQNGSRDVCILSVRGSISNVTIREPATSGGTATYEGLFDIVSLTGSFTLSKFGSQKRRIGGLSIQVAGSDGTVLGGSVAGLLVAASPVQVIIGSYEEEESNEMKSAQLVEPSSAPPKLNEMKSAQLVEPSSAPPKLNCGGGDAGVDSSQLHGTVGESSGRAASPHNPSSAS